MEESGSRWAGRFIWLAIVNGAIAAAWTIFLIWPTLSPPPTMIVASGSAGTWLLFGYLLYLVVGVLGIATTALFYHYVEDIIKRKYTGIRNILAALHFSLMELGTIGATSLLMYAGYIGGSDLLPTAVGGKGMTVPQVHEVLVNFVQPIFVFTIVALLGAILGGLGYLMSSRAKQ